MPYLSYRQNLGISDSGATFVLVPHLDPTHASLMVELLARHAKMPVCEAGDQMVIQPNCEVFCLGGSSAGSQ
jgi:chemotaxis response regulator CheB